MEKQVYGYYPLLGCDPELFFERRGKIVGSERVTPEGLSFEGPILHALGGGKIVCDGVQVELNPTPTTCRGNLGNELKLAFNALRRHLANLGEISVNFSAVVELDKDALNALSEKSRRLGCKPSLNWYGKQPSIQVDGNTYRSRSAGGHIHLGLTNALMPHRHRLAPLLDVLVGNTCVLIDRDPYAAKRRELYGRAGEHRLPAHGFEYRTLSNFWLKSYPLMSLVFGLSRLATSVLYTTKTLDMPTIRWNAEGALLKLVNLEKVERAINKNDQALAEESFEGVQQFISSHVQDINDCGLHAKNLPEFRLFLQKVEERGLDFWFPEDPMEHWCKPDPHMCHGTGWESFLTNIVHPLMRKDTNVAIHSRV